MSNGDIKWMECFSCCSNHGKDYQASFIKTSSMIKNIYRTEGDLTFLSFLPSIKLIPNVRVMDTINAGMIS